LADLIRLRLTPNLLQGKDLRDSRAREHAMTPTAAGFLESERLKQSDQVTEATVPHRTGKDAA